MVSDLFKSLGLTGRILAMLTGQTDKSVSRKVRRNQGLALGAREAGIIACFRLMTPEQREQVPDEFRRVMDQFSDDDTGAR